MAAESAAQIAPVSSSTSQYRVIRRNGQVTDFDGSKIAVAITKAFLAVEGDSAQNSRRIHDIVATITKQITDNLTRRLDDGGTVHIEDIQDQVELTLMREGEYKTARAYVLYRESQAQKRAVEEKQHPTAVNEPTINVTLADGTKQPLDVDRLSNLISEACDDVAAVKSADILRDTLRNIFDGVSPSDVEKALVMSARTFIEKDPGYSTVAARLLLDSIRREALTFVYKKDTQVL
jgi:ribonucleoside-diphosphate reductase alpha chain